MKRRPKEIPYIPKDRRRSRYAPREGGRILASNKGIEALRQTDADARRSGGKKKENGCGFIFFLVIAAVGFGDEIYELARERLDISRPEAATRPPDPEPVEESGERPPVADLPVPPTSGPFTPPVGNFAGLFSTDDYPEDALRAGIEGVVRASLVVGPDGRVEECLIFESSGNEALDAKTCEIFRERARFEPARDAEGGAMRVSFAAPPVGWQIP